MDDNSRKDIEFALDAIKSMGFEGVLFLRKKKEDGTYEYSKTSSVNELIESVILAKSIDSMVGFTILNLALKLYPIEELLEMYEELSYKLSDDAASRNMNGLSEISRMELDSVKNSVNKDGLIETIKEMFKNL